MQEFNFIDTTFQKERSDQYQLTIQTDIDAFSFCIYDNRLKKHVVFRRYLLNTKGLTEEFLKQLEILFRDDDLLTLPYSAASFMVLSQKSTLIPDAYFDKNLLKSYLEFNHALDSLDEIHFNYIPSIDAYNVFSIHTYVATEITNHIHGIQFYHQHCLLLKKCWNTPPTNKNISSR